MEDANRQQKETTPLFSISSRICRTARILREEGVDLQKTSFIVATAVVVVFFSFSSDIHEGLILCRRLIFSYVVLFLYPSPFSSSNTHICTRKRKRTENHGDFFSLSNVIMSVQMRERYMRWGLYTELFLMMKKTSKSLVLFGSVIRLLKHNLSRERQIIINDVMIIVNMLTVEND